MGTASRLLSLFRHAKSAWDDPRLPDFARPLAPRGRKAAPRMGAWMASQGLMPDLVLCSAARRARETLALALPKMGSSPQVEFREDFYMASPRHVLSVVKRLPDTVRHVLVVGHNPCLEMLAERLVGEGDALDLKALRRKFPTAALAVIAFPDTASWADIGSGKGRLRHFMRPKALPL